MSTIHCEIVTPERVVFSDDVDIVTLPGESGMMGVLPKHAPLMSLLTEGEVVARKDKDEFVFAVGGGFVEVLPDKVVVLARSAEYAEEIDIARAEAAMRRAEELLASKPPESERLRAEHAIRRSRVRLKVARRKARRRARPPITGPGSGSEEDQ